MWVIKKLGLHYIFGGLCFALFVWTYNSTWVLTNYKIRDIILYVFIAVYILLSFMLYRKIVFNIKLEQRSKLIFYVFLFNVVHLLLLILPEYRIFSFLGILEGPITIDLILMNPVGVIVISIFQIDSMIINASILTVTSPFIMLLYMMLDEYIYKIKSDY